MDQETAQYVIRYYGQFMTDEEKLVCRYLMLQDKIDHSGSPEMRSRLRQDQSDDPHVRERASHGEIFVQQVADRLLKTHPEKIHLNYCPRCGRIAKTPKAKRCRFCFHDWHNA